jgi:hypothetical protein
MVASQTSMEMLKEFWKRVQPHYIWWVVGAVLALYVGAWLSYFFWDLKWLSNILAQAATALVVSGVFASLLKSYQFSELFKGELERFFSSPGMISKMREIAIYGRTGDDVLHKAMEHSLNVHCPELHPRFSESVTKLLRPSNDYVHKGYERQITFLDYSAETKKIKIRDDVSCALIAMGATEFKSHHSGIAYDDGKTNLVMLELQTNGVVECMKSKAVLGNKTMSVRFPLQAGVRYRFRRVVEQEYELYRDPVLHQQFVRFCDGLRIELVNKVPDKIGFDVRFINFSEHIEPSVLGGAGDPTLEHTYTIDHLTFPFQGYIVTVTPTN